MTNFLQLVFSGIAQGAVLALVALGFSMIYSTTKLLNFAQGHYVVLGGVFTWYLTDRSGFALFVAIPIAALAVAAIAVVTYEGLLKRTRNKTHFNEALITLGTGLLIDAVLLLKIGADPVYLDPFSGSKPVTVFGSTFSRQGLWVIAITAITLAILIAFERRTRAGQEMLATSMDAEAASLLGVNVSRTVAVSWALSGAMGAIGGAILLPISGAGFGMGLVIALQGFTAAVIGGLGSPVGAVVGGMVIGVSTALLTGYVDSDIAGIAIAAGLLAVLLVRPQGLLGRYRASALTEEGSVT